MWHATADPTTTSPEWIDDMCRIAMWELDDGRVFLIYEQQSCSNPKRAVAIEANGVLTPLYPIKTWRWVGDFVFEVEGLRSKKQYRLKGLDPDACPRCEGEGYRPDRPRWNRANMRDAFRCFRCGGTGKRSKTA